MLEIELPSHARGGICNRLAMQPSEVWLEHGQIHLRQSERGSACAISCEAAAMWAPGARLEPWGEHSDW